MSFARTSFKISSGIFRAEQADFPYFHQADLDAERDVILNSIRFADGKIYSLYSYAPFPWNELPYRVWINQSWLDQLGMSAPTTTEEFRTVLEAFKNNDLNGNGKPDEIPMITAKEGFGRDSTAGRPEIL